MFKPLQGSGHWLQRRRLKGFAEKTPVATIPSCCVRKGWWKIKAEMGNAYKHTETPTCSTGSSGRLWAKRPGTSQYGANPGPRLGDGFARVYVGRLRGLPGSQGLPSCHSPDTQGWPPGLEVCSVSCRPRHPQGDHSPQLPPFSPGLAGLPGHQPLVDTGRGAPPLSGDV